ncbi:hypothetical protein [Archangium primigenium]|uniref:hypothetical protein n=1 Tax=[Archangium] primigenium TaxID=2792470 RepID=UPI00195F092C|nr:hypothetical protein [Archangium primigenium]MBM7113691.1 hypothetical protein [Archangium primigenium]
MNDRDEETRLDTLLRHQGLPSLPDDGFQMRVLQRLPPPERKGRRALVFLLTGVMAIGVLVLTSEGGNGVKSSLEAGSLLVPSSLATALLWYLVDRSRG